MTHATGAARWQRLAGELDSWLPMSIRHIVPVEYFFICHGERRAEDAS